jgi:hypothetical protein
MLQQVFDAVLVVRAPASCQGAGEIEQAARDPRRRLRARIRLEPLLVMADGVIPLALRCGKESEVARGCASEVDATATEDAEAVARQEQLVEAQCQPGRKRAATTPSRRCSAARSRS